MEDQTELLRELLRREEAKIHMADFVPYVTEGDHRPAPHHRIICQALDRVVRGHCKRLIIAAPPAHAKSVYSSHNFPAFWLGNYPTSKVIAVSHTQPFAEDIGRKVRNLVQNPLYGQLFDGVSIDPASRAAARWDTTAGGSYFTTGVGGSVVGRRANLILIDDPYKSKQVAFSPAERKKISEWYFTDIVPRLLPEAAIVIIATRWHEDDLTGEILRKSEAGEIEPFELISLTAVCEDPENDPMGRAYGEALWPSQYPYEKLMEIKGGLTDATGDLAEWNALFQQRPKPADSGEVSLSWFEKHDNNALPPDQEYLSIVSWDTAGTSNERSDYTVGLACKMGLKDRKFYLTDMYRQRSEFHTLMRDIPSFNAKHQAQAVLLENRGTGTSLLQVLRNSGQNIIPIQPQKQGGKEFRFELAIPALEAKRVSLPRNGGEWVSYFQEELLTFPGSNYDDVVDAFSQMINHYAQRATTRGMRSLRGY